MCYIQDIKVYFLSNKINSTAYSLKLDQGCHFYIDDNVITSHRALDLENNNAGVSRV